MIRNSRRAPIHGLLGPWDAIAQPGALGLTLLAVPNLRPPLNAFTSSFRPRRRRRAGILSSKVLTHGSTREITRKQTRPSRGTCACLTHAIGAQVGCAPRRPVSRDA